MNIKTYNYLKNHEIEALRCVDVLYITPKTLFKKDNFKDLSEKECHSKAINLGWRWDFKNGKYYRIVGF